MIIGRKIAFTYAGADSELGIACDSATPSAAKQITPAARNTSSASQSPGHGMLKNIFPARITIATCSTLLVTALAPIPARYADDDSGVPRRRLRIPRSRRNVML